MEQCILQLMRPGTFLIISRDLTLLYSINIPYQVLPYTLHNKIEFPTLQINGYKKGRKEKRIRTSGWEQLRSH